MIDKKKKAAAIAGVMALLNAEKETPGCGAIPEKRSGTWAAYGRQLTMINRNQMQRRVVKR